MIKHYNKNNGGLTVYIYFLHTFYLVLVVYVATEIVFPILKMSNNNTIHLLSTNTFIPIDVYGPSIAFSMYWPMRGFEAIGTPQKEWMEFYSISIERFKGNITCI